MSKKTKTNSEILSKNEKLILSKYREESQFQKSEIIEITDFNLITFLNNLDDSLNNIIDTKIDILNKYLSKFESSKNKIFKEYENDISDLVNNLFSLINIDQFADKELNKIKKEMLENIEELGKDDRNHVKYSNFSSRLRNIFENEIATTDKKFKKIITDSIELYKNEIIDIEIKNRKLTINEFLNSYLTRLTTASNFLDEDKNDVNILFKRSTENKLYFEFSQNNFNENIDKKSLDKISKQFSEIITRDIKDNIINYTENFNMQNNDEIKSRIIDENGNIKYAGFENNFKNYSYKELNSLAAEKGFTLDRCRGDHGIFINNTGKVIVIPQGRSIGKGLQTTIIKSLNQY